MDEISFQDKMNQILERIRELPANQAPGATEAADGADARRQRVQSSVNELQDALDYLDARGRWAERAPIGPTLMLLDVHMPGGPDGYEVLARIKADPAATHITVILHTGADDPADAARAQALGCVTTLAKPADHATIVATLTKALVLVE